MWPSTSEYRAKFRGGYGDFRGALVEAVGVVTTPGYSEEGLVGYPNLCSMSSTIRVLPH